MTSAPLAATAALTSPNSLLLPPCLLLYLLLLPLPPRSCSSYTWSPMIPTGPSELESLPLSGVIS